MIFLLASHFLSLVEFLRIPKVLYPEDFPLVRRLGYNFTSDCCKALTLETTPKMTEWIQREVVAPWRSMVLQRRTTNLGLMFSECY